MSIYAPTPLLISTGPLSATRCQPCSMMAISRWWAGSPGKVATAPQPSPVCQSAPCLSQFPHTPLLPECVFFFFLGRWKQGQKEQCLQCLFLTSAVNVGSIRACVFNPKKMPRALFFLSWTSHAVNMTSIIRRSSPNHGKCWGTTRLLDQSRKLCSVGHLVSHWKQHYCMQTDW